MERPSGPHVQGVIALADNRVEDGGTVLVPGFHATFAKWSRALGSSWRAYAETHADADANRLVWRGDGAGSFKARSPYTGPHTTPFAR